MALRDFQTAAAHVLHYERASDAAINDLKARFGYHPLDLEALLSVPVESSFSAYGSYAFLTLLWPDAENSVLSELYLFIDHRQLVVIGDTSDKTLSAFFATVQNTVTGQTAQMSAPELFHEVVRVLTAKASLLIQPDNRVIHALAAMALVIRQLARWLQEQEDRHAVPSLIIDAHMFDSIADHLRRHSSRVPAVRTDDRMLRLPKILRTYAVASAVMVILVLVTLSLS